MIMERILDLQVVSLHSVLLSQTIQSAVDLQNRLCVEVHVDQNALAASRVQVHTYAHYVYIGNKHLGV